MRKALAGVVVSCTSLVLAVSCGALAGRVDGHPVSGVPAAAATASQPVGAAALAAPRFPELAPARPRPTPSTTTPAPPLPPTPPPVVAVLGDSYTTGQPGVGGLDAANWSEVLAAREGWDLQRDAIGGTGFAVPSGLGPPFGARVADVIAQHPSLVVVWSARNDLADPDAQVAAAADQVLRALCSGLPGTPVVVIGPAWVNRRGDSPARFRSERDALAAVTRGLGLPFLDPIAEDWFPAGQPDLVGIDHVHPSDLGHVHVADVVQADLTRLGLVSGRRSG